MTAYLMIVSAFVGASIGSFINVVVSRIRVGESPLTGRSYCDVCKRTLLWHELIPVIGFFRLRGRCPTCGGKILFRYTLVEIVTALLFISLFYGIEAGRLNVLDSAIITAIYYGLLIAGAVLVSLYDMLYLEIPAWCIPVLAAVAVIRHILEFGLDARTLFPWLATAAGIFLFFWFLWRFSGGRAMGRGDSDVAGMLALYLGPTLVIPGLLFSVWLGALVGVGLLVSRKARMTTPLPFAPFLFAGFFLALAFSEELAVVRFLVYGF